MDLSNFGHFWGGEIWDFVRRKGEWRCSLLGKVSFLTLEGLVMSQVPDGVCGDECGGGVECDPIFGGFAGVSGGIAGCGEDCGDSGGGRSVGIGLSADVGGSNG
jgi:hypothetical protein